MAVSEDEIPTGAPKPGELFADKYRVERVLGVGGMGFVIAATHIHLRERVAIKMLLPQLSGHPDTVERFLREGRAAVKIRSEHIARILDVGELEDRSPYLVMEYLEGADFADVVYSRGRLPPPEAVDYVLQACEAIAEAHAHKTVHRDLKPSNLFLSTRPDGSTCVKVLDFGISKLTTPEAGALAMTKTSAMMGSPLYMSPEQLKSARNVDERADIWALGVILFELMNGKPPFMAESLAELGVLVLSQDAPWLSTAAPEVPEGLSAVVNTCLKREASERFASLADFADALAPFGTPAARISADVIIRTLGMPAARAAVLAPPAAPSHPAPITRTLVVTPPPAQAAASPWAQPTRSSWGTTQAPEPRGRSNAVTAAFAAFLLLGLVGVAAIGFGLTQRKQAHARPLPDVPSSTVAPSSTSPSEASPAAVAEPATSATSATSAGAASSAHPHAEPTARPLAVRPLPVANAKPRAAPSAPAPTGPARPSDIAQSSKD
jgi:eukaryotic-like serine/threonine-protein kinase